MGVRHTSVTWLRYDKIKNVVQPHTFFGNLVTNPFCCIMTTSLQRHFQLSWFISGTSKSPFHIRTLPCMPMMSNYVSDSSIRKSWQLLSLMTTYSRRIINTTLTHSNGTKAYKTANSEHSHLPLGTHATLESSNSMDPWNPPHISRQQCLLGAKQQLLHTTTIAASIEAIYGFLGKSVWSKQQDPISFNKLEEMIISYCLHILGHIVNTQCMDIETPPKFITGSNKLSAPCGTQTKRCSSYRTVSPSQGKWDTLPLQHCGYDSYSWTFIHWLLNASNCTITTYQSQTNNSVLSSKSRRTKRHCINRCTYTMACMAKATHLLQHQHFIMKTLHLDLTPHQWHLIQPHNLEKMSNFPLQPQGLISNYLFPLLQASWFLVALPVAKSHPSPSG